MLIKTFLQLFYVQYRAALKCRNGYTVLYSRENVQQGDQNFHNSVSIVFLIMSLYACTNIQYLHMYLGCRSYENCWLFFYLIYKIHQKFYRSVENVLYRNSVHVRDLSSMYVFSRTWNTYRCISIWYTYMYISYLYIGICTPPNIETMYMHSVHAVLGLIK